MEYTREEIQNITRQINNLIMMHDKKGIEKLCKANEYALHYFIGKAIEEINNIKER